MTAAQPVCFLFDNGSLRAESTLNLRVLSARLETELGREVRPVSLFHSSAVHPDELAGRPAELLEPALVSALRGGALEFVLLPLFFGPSEFLTGYLPKRLAGLRAEHPDLRVKLAAPLVDVRAADDVRLAAILAGNVRRVIAARRLVRPAVILVDHGSPQREVTAVRDFLARQVRGLLGGEAEGVVAASMERRPGSEYTFGEPLLDRALDERRGGEVVVALQFFSPGRHAGPGGDIEQICRAAEQKNPGLRVHLTGLVGTAPQLIGVLADRYREASLAAIKPTSRA